MAEPEDILEMVQVVLGYRGDLAGQRVVVTAGGTREAIDPVRFISNRASGKMGYAIATVARNRGATVTLITAASLPAPVGVEVILVNSAEEMLDAVLTTTREADILVMAAAVADFRPRRVAQQKIKKSRTVKGWLLN
jgi:phosphopantothenoylcysteine decarboxylase/phosphopantothenate--cysteine ligase